MEDISKETSGLYRRFVPAITKVSLPFSPWLLSICKRCDTNICVN
uniref:Uncharacterized protein n=1 Tax=Manihot esculenta TaxID=3983 RepID=A0A2C9WIC8_MANES